MRLQFNNKMAGGTMKKLPAKKHSTYEYYNLTFNINSS